MMLLFDFSTVEGTCSKFVLYRRCVDGTEQLAVERSLNAVKKP